MGAAHGHSGLTPAEAAIMDRWDAGKGSRLIARELGLRERKVNHIIAQYHHGDTGLSQRSTIAGSQKLLAAIQRARSGEAQAQPLP